MNPNSKSSPKNALARLAQEVSVSTEEVTSLYDNEVDKLSRDAAVCTFIPALALRHTREILTGRSNCGRYVNEPKLTRLQLHMRRHITSP